VSGATSVPGVTDADARDGSPVAILTVGELNSVTPANTEPEMDVVADTVSE
jgi:hypothetical protein